MDNRTHSAYMNLADIQPWFYNYYYSETIVFIETPLPKTITM